MAHVRSAVHRRHDTTVVRSRFGGKAIETIDTDIEAADKKQIKRVRSRFSSSLPRPPASAMHTDSVDVDCDLPSGVVEVLEISEEAGLFFRIVGRIFVQDVGHACCCWIRGTVCVWSHGFGGGGGERKTWPLGNGRARSSALDVREHFTPSSSLTAASASLSPAVAVAAAATVIYAVADLSDGRAHPALLARTRQRRPRRRWHHSPVGSACRPVPVVRTTTDVSGVGTRTTKKKQNKQTTNVYIIFYSHVKRM